MKKILILLLVASYHSSAQNSLEKIPKPFELLLLEIIFISDTALQIIETSIRGKEAAGSVIVNEKLKRIE